MAKVDVSQLSDEELDAFLERNAEKPDRLATSMQEAGGTPLEHAIVMLVAGLLGMFASVELLLAEKELLTHPSAPLACDINPIIGCGTFLQADFNSLFFGISNAVYGLAFFSGITALGLVLLGRGQFNVWLWRALDLAMVGASIWLVWFWYTAFFVEKGLCPYCLVTWFATIPLIVHTLARSAQARHYPTTRGIRRFLVGGRWYIVGGIYLALVIFATVWFWDQWVAIF